MSNWNFRELYEYIFSSDVLVFEELDEKNGTAVCQNNVAERFYVETIHNWEHIQMKYTSFPSRLLRVYNEDGSMVQYYLFLKVNGILFFINLFFYTLQNQINIFVRELSDEIRFIDQETWVLNREHFQPLMDYLKDEHVVHDPKTRLIMLANEVKVHVGW